MQDLAGRLDAIHRDSLGLDHLPKRDPALEVRLRAFAPEFEVRLCAFACGELRLEPSTVPRTPLDKGLLLRRCALPDAPGVRLDTVLEYLEGLGSEDLDMSVVWQDFSPEQLAHPQAVCELSEVAKKWFVPMQAFCRAHQPGPGTQGQRSELCDLLCRCGWADEPRALWLVLKILRWDSVELLHFALQLLRQHYTRFWLPLAKVLVQSFGYDAVLPLYKALDPTLTLALIAAAPGPIPVR